MFGQGQSQHSGEGLILKAFEEIRAGRYEEALVALKEHLHRDPDDFWGWFLDAVAWGFLGNREELLSSLAKVRALNPGSVFPSYLEAYISLLEGNLEQALLHWTRQIDYDEGWLARDLIEQARKGKDLISLAQSQGLEPFIILPDIMERLTLHAPHESDGDPVSATSRKPPKKKAPSRSGNLPLKWIIAVGSLVFVSLAAVFLLPSWEGPEKKSGELWRDFTIDSSIQLTVRPEKDLPSERYQFKDKESLIEDFEKAKKLMADSKFNQARFLLQRIFHSNADFKTREKTRIFLTFIPEPAHEDFSDPLFPGQLMQTPLYYTDALVLWQGTVLKLEEKEGGRRVKMVVNEGEREYLVEAFLPEEEKGKWQPYEEFDEKRKELENRKMQAVVYGKFKGLIGPQKIIYLELLRLWL